MEKVLSLLVQYEDIMPYSFCKYEASYCEFTLFKSEYVRKLYKYVQFEKYFDCFKLHNFEPKECQGT